MRKIIRMGSLSFVTLLWLLGQAPSARSAQLAEKAPGLRPQVLQAALTAYNRAQQEGRVKRPFLTVIDYSLPSTQKRLWVIDMATNHIRYTGLVAHGKHSGLKYAHHFSNEKGSRDTSLGVFVTGDTYQGRHGYSLRVYGLERGFNHNASSRAVVFHGGHYVTPRFADQHGYLGRSWGCFALNPNDYHRVIHAIRGGSVVVSYYPDKQWLHHSHYL